MPKATTRTSKNSKSGKTAPAAPRTRGKPAAPKKTRKPPAKPAAKPPRAARKTKAAPPAGVGAGAAANESSGALRAERDELLSSIAAAEQRLRDLHRQAEELAAIREELDAARAEAVEAARGRAGPAGPEGQPDELPRVPALAPDERAGDLRQRLVRFLNDAWGVEKEQVDLLRMLAEESGDRDVRALLEEHRAASGRQQAALETRMTALGVRPSGGRGLLGKLATRLWDAMEKPRDQADEAVLALLKAVSAAECEAGVYATVHSYARAAGDGETAELAAAHYREERARGDRLRAALAPAVVRAARR
jgi:ferritin-like metal-binding protein YciE